jgi:hypothetical protein
MCADADADRHRPELRRGVEQRSDLCFGIDVRDEPAVNWTKEVGRHDLRPGLELGAEFHKGPEHLEPPGPRQPRGPSCALGPAHRHGDGERTLMARVIGEPGEGE